MRFLVSRTRRAGVLIPERELRAVPGVLGELRVHEQPDPLLRRTVRVATLCNPSVGKQRDLMPPLYDPHLLWAAAGGVAVGGVERISLPGGALVEYGQVWWMRVP